jgi:glycosyltransferase involved in cell wall biosynthesis
MNVLYLTANPNRASSNVPTEGWFRLLPQHGLRPVLVSDSDGEFCHWTRSQQIPTYVVPLSFPDKRRPWRYVAMLWKLRQIVRRSGIQLIHAIEQNVYPVAADVARLCNLPAVVGVHCRIERGFGEWAFGGRRQPDRLFFLTRGSREVCRAAVDGIVPESRWALLPNGIDLDSFRPDPGIGQRFRAEHQLGSRQLLGAASWLRPGKQLEHLFRVVAAIEDRNVALVIAGGVAPGEELYAKQLISDAEELLGSRFRYLGCLRDLRGFYNALSLYVNTSREESFGISVLESLSCGCPVVGYNSKAINEIVLPDGGEITSQDDIDQLVETVGKWLSIVERVEDTRSGPRRQAERFDIGRISDQLWDEYEQLLAERRPQRSPAAAAAVAGTS